MSEPHDIRRLIGDIARLGTIESVDRAAGTCRMRIGDLVTADLPWIAQRAGRLTIWSPPSVGEQCLLLCPEADTEAGVVLPGIYSTARPAPSADERFLLQFDDGTLLAIDPDAHAIELVAGGNGTLRLAAAGGIRIEGPLHVTGTVTADAGAEFAGDVKAGGTSLRHHKHLLVKTGTDQSGEPA